MLIKTTNIKIFPLTHELNILILNTQEPVSSYEPSKPYNITSRFTALPFRQSNKNPRKPTLIHQTFFGLEKEIPPQITVPKRRRASGRNVKKSFGSLNPFTLRNGMSRVWNKNKYGRRSSHDFSYERMSCF